MKSIFGILFISGVVSLWAQADQPNLVEKQVIEFLGGEAPKVLRLWPEDSVHHASRSAEPESALIVDGTNMRLSDTSAPSLLVYMPPKGVMPNGTGMVFCPGGAYNKLGMLPPAMMIKWMGRLGATVAILKYHVPRSKDDPDHVVPLRDAQRALSLLRSRASEFNLDANKIGICGSSAGGHLAFNVTTRHAKRAYEALDSIDQVSCRPDFTLLFYPAYLNQVSTSFEPSATIAYESLNEKTTPPLFMMIASDDKFITGNLAAMVKIRSAKVPAEFHVVYAGGHGGMFDSYPKLEFARPAIRFLQRHGFFNEAAVIKSDAFTDAQRELTMPMTRVATPALVEKELTLPKGIAESEYSEIEKSMQTMIGHGLTVYRLWPNDGARADDAFKAEKESLIARNVPVGSNVTIPSMTFFPAKKPNGKVVLVFPGGGYSVLAYEHEGTGVATWLNEQGISAFIVKYRTPRREGLDKHHVALQDAQRAIRLVRSQAKAFGVDPEKIGTLGFSAGGHLAALTGVDFKEALYAPIDDHDKVSFHANFNVLIYPAYTTTEMFNNQLDPLFKRDGKTKSVPTFIASALDDKFTHGMFYLMHEFEQNKIPMECHVYENGGHGKGITPSEFSFSQWTRDCQRWLDDLGHWKVNSLN